MYIYPTQPQNYLISVVKSVNQDQHSKISKRKVFGDLLKLLRSRCRNSIFSLCCQRKERNSPQQLHLIFKKKYFFTFSSFFSGTPTLCICCQRKDGSRFSPTIASLVQNPHSLFYPSQTSPNSPNSPFLSLQNNSSFLVFKIILRGLL